MKFRKHFFAIFLLLIISFFNIDNVSASTKFKMCNNLTEASYLRSTPNGIELRDVDGQRVLLHDPTVMEILETVNHQGENYYKVSANYYSNNYVGYIKARWITGCSEYTTDDNYGNTLRKQGFPESYILPLQKLHAIHPNWNFIASGPMDWDSSLNEEVAQVDRNLIDSSADISLRSTENGAYVNGEYKKFDNGNWYAASRQTVAFYMDPRNWLNEMTIFMFEQLSYDKDTQTKDNIQKMLNESFLNGTYNLDGANISYADTFVEAGQKANVSSFHLVSRVLQEQGINGDSATINMDGGDGKYYYNYFNFGASGNTAAEIVANALEYAKGKSWNNPKSAILGGAAALASEYINSNQDTIYYQKFNTINRVFYHQYQQNVRVAPTEARSHYYTYYVNNLLNNNLTFKIPIYNGMPNATTLSINENGDNTLKSLSVSGCNLNPNFNSSTLSYLCEVSSNVNSVNVTAQAVSDYSKVTGTGNEELKEGTTTIEVIVTALNGNQKKYSINVVKSSANNASPSDVLSKAGLNVDGNYVSGIKLSSNRETLISNLKNTYSSTNVKYTLSNGTDINSGIVSTGDKVTITLNNVTKTYIVVIKGDVNGDGMISAIDYSRIKGYFLGKYNLSDEYFKAADVSKDNSITAIDYSRVKGYFLGKYNIEQ